MDSRSTAMNFKLQIAIDATMYLNSRELAELLAAVSIRLKGVSQWDGIQKTPGVCGGAACVRSTRIPVWVLVQARQLGYTDGDLFYNYPSLNAEDLTNVWAYAEENAKEINLAIIENNNA